MAKLTGDKASPVGPTVLGTSRQREECDVAPLQPHQLSRLCASSSKQKSPRQGGGSGPVWGALDENSADNWLVSQWFRLADANAAPGPARRHAIARCSLLAPERLSGQRNELGFIGYADHVIRDDPRCDCFTRFL